MSTASSAPGTGPGNMSGNSPRTGEIAAALVAAGVGSTFLGLIVVLAEASGTIAGQLSFYPPTGSLSGKALLTLFVWLLSWGVLHHRWKGRGVNLSRVVGVTALLVALGLLGTFPPFFYLFG